MEANHLMAAGIIIAIVVILALLVLIRHMSKEMRRLKISDSYHRGLAQGQAERIEQLTSK